MKTLGKRGRGLDPAIMIWLMNTLQLGPGLGDIHVLVTEGSAYDSWVRDDLRVEPSHIHFEFAAAEDALTAGRNDVLCAYPGTYPTTAAVAWDKKNTHVVGLGGPNVRSDYSEGNVNIYTVTAAQANVLNITGAHCQFINVGFDNNADDGGNLSAVLLNALGAYFKNCSIRGVYAATQRSTAAASSLYIHTNAHNALFEGCTLGQCEWGLVSGTNQAACVSFTGSQPNNGHFKDCRFSVLAEDTDVVAVGAAVNNGYGRNWLFERCGFYVYNNAMSNLNQVFRLQGGYDIVLHDCHSDGFDEWQDLDGGKMVISMPVSSTSGGLTRQPTAAIS